MALAGLWENWKSPAHDFVEGLGHAYPTSRGAMATKIRINSTSATLVRTRGPSVGLPRIVKHRAASAGRSIVPRDLGVS
jgi:hypothetical protein